MPVKNVAFVGATCVIVGWLLASTLTPPIVRVQSRPQPPAPAADANEGARFAERLQLQLQLRDLPAAPERRRNPFAFASRERVTPVPVTAEEIAPAAMPEATPLNPAPLFSLSGIGISGEVRTAVLTTGRDVHIVKVMDLVGGFTVAEISDDSVTLTRGDERHVLRFAH